MKTCDFNYLELIEKYFIYLSMYSRFYPTGQDGIRNYIKNPCQACYLTGVNFLPYYLWTFTVTDTDTTYIEPDTAKIVEDFLIRREYEFTVFDNENGKFIASPTVQYNRLQSFDYSFTPIQKEITRYREKVFTPFVGMSYNTLNYIGIIGGIFYHNLGLEYQYSKNIISSSDVHEMGLKVKF